MQYMIPQIAAITIIVNGRRTADGWQIMLDRQDPSCRYMVERTLQDDCPIFYQAIAALGDLGMTADKRIKTRCQRCSFTLTSRTFSA